MEKHEKGKQVRVPRDNNNYGWEGRWWSESSGIRSKLILLLNRMRKKVNLRRNQKLHIYDADVQVSTLLSGIERLHFLKNKTDFRHIK